MCRDYEERLQNSLIEKTFFKKDLPEKYHILLGTYILFIKNEEELKYVNKKYGHFNYIDGKYNHYNDRKGLTKISSWVLVKELMDNDDIEKHAYTFEYLKHELEIGIEFIEKNYNDKRFKRFE